MSDTQQLEDHAAELVRRALEGDAGARDELLRRCHGPVHRWATGLVTDLDDADDVVQEVLIRVAMRLNRYAGRSQFTTWLYRVTRNTALSLRRRVASRLRLMEALYADADPDPHRVDDPLDRAHGSQVAGRIGVLFRQLPNRQREVFYLVDMEGQGAVETARELGLSPATVRAHLFRARRTLRARLLERHPEIAEEHER